MANEAVNQAEELRQRAIGLLVAERSTIDAALARLGFDGAMPATSNGKGKRNGAPRSGVTEVVEPFAETRCENLTRCYSDSEGVSLTSAS